MADEDLAEMAQLRKANQFQKHIQTHGDRSWVRAQRRVQEQKMEEQRDRIREAWTQQHSGEEAKEEDTIVEGEDAIAMANMGMPLEFGKKKVTVAHNKEAVLAQHTRKPSDEDEEKVAGPAPPPKEGEAEDSDEDMEAAPPPSESLTEKFKLPITHEAALARHGKPVSALTLDTSGTRVISGALDGKLKFWDFGGMTAELRGFREKEPEEGHPVVAVSYNPSGSHFLCCTASVQPKIFDREGMEKCQFVRGDMYLHDMKYTKGHTASVTGGYWHPTDREQVLTSSVDGTMRLWSIEQPIQCLNTIKLQPAAVKRIAVNSCCYSPDGSLVAGGGNDGSVRVWHAKKGAKYLRPDLQVMNAHEPGEEVTSVNINGANHLLASRSTDCTMKIWDLRKFKDPVKVYTDLENRYSSTGVIFDPLDRLILTATSNNKHKQLDRGKIMIYDANTFELVQGISLGNEAVIRVLWHPTINQIFGTCSDGTIRVLYSPTLSTKGVLLAVGKRPAVKAGEDFIEYFNVKAPNHLPYFDEGRSHQSRKIKIRNNDAKLTKLPEKPLESDFGTGGRTFGNTMNQHIARNIVKRKIDARGQDPRAELLKYADKAKADPMFFGRAYKETQPVPLFDTSAVDADEAAVAELVSNKRLGQTDNHRLYNPGAG